jgi:hypothetical protein
MNSIAGQGWRAAAIALAGVVVFSTGFSSGALRARQGGPLTPGSALKAGATLTYGSGGREQPAWTIDSVHRDVALGGRTGCTRIHLRTRPDQPQPTVRVACRGGDTLFAWSAANNVWRAERPLGAGMSLRVPQPTGSSLDYSTGQMGDTTISGQRVAFVHTTIITNDAQGRPVRRLTERYAVSLATALGGVFEIPDSTGEGAGAWKENQRFELVRISIP